MFSSLRNSTFSSVEDALNEELDLLGLGGGGHYRSYTRRVLESQMERI
jgi:hypothetical protein